VIMDDLGLVRFRHGTPLAQLFRILDSAGHSSRQQNVQSGTMSLIHFAKPNPSMAPGISISLKTMSTTVSLLHEHGHRLIRIGDLIPAVPKVLRNGHADQNFILNKKNCFLTVGLVGHARQRVTAAVRSSARKHFDVFNQAPDIIGLGKEAIVVAPMTGRERLGGRQHDLDLGMLRSDCVSEFHPVQPAGHSNVTEQYLHAHTLQQVESLVRV
jgi:hypothetical protein